ncbi:MAG TPA: hypothetical protein VNZ27_10495 [Rhodanobacter sp.]|jgi:hypothetical protein|nr:hypothetical protein [Rhodanobacter sp.]
MRVPLLVAIAITLAACQARTPETPVRVRNPAFNYSSDAYISPPLPAEFSHITYDAEIVGYGENGKVVKVVHEVPVHALAAYDGQLLGGDRGEWGGELLFRDSKGEIHRLLEKNVHGIFEMPFGIVAFTGLAHMNSNQGAIYIVSRNRNNDISVNISRRLPGAPRDVFRTEAGDVVFRVSTGEFKDNSASREETLDCYLLKKSGAIEALPCSSVTKVG